MSTHISYSIRITKKSPIRISWHKINQAKRYDRTCRNSVAFKIWFPSWSHLSVIMNAKGFSRRIDSMCSAITLALTIQIIYHSHKLQSYPMCRIDRLGWCLRDNLLNSNRVFNIIRLRETHIQMRNYRISPLFKGWLTLWIIMVHWWIHSSTTVKGHRKLKISRLISLYWFFIFWLSKKEDTLHWLNHNSNSNMHLRCPYPDHLLHLLLEDTTVSWITLKD